MYPFPFETSSYVLVTHCTVNVLPVFIFPGQKKGKKKNDLPRRPLPSLYLTTFELALDTCLMLRLYTLGEIVSVVDVYVS